MIFLSALVIGISPNFLVGCSKQGSGEEKDAGTGAADQGVNTDDGSKTTESVTDSVHQGDSSSASDTNDFEACTETKATAEKHSAKTNLIIAVDTSGSMNAETEMVQDNINNRFAQKFGANPDIDVHIVLIAKPLDDPTSSGDGMCVSPPLGSGTCPDDSNPAELFWHIPETVRSHDALETIVACWSKDGCQEEGWQEYMSPGGFVHFVVVSDDDSRMTAAEFIAWANGQFGADWMFHGIVSKTDRTGDNATAQCEEYSANEGAVYKELIAGTGGVFGDLCVQKDNEFDVVFDQITTEVITHVKMPCQWTLPVPPGDEVLDPQKVNVVFEDGATSLELGKVSQEADCAAVEHGWYYDDAAAPTKIIVCPQTCQWIQGRPDAQMLIKFGCQSKDAQPVK
jgi:hypothetical protein